MISLKVLIYIFYSYFQVLVNMFKSIQLTNQFVRNNYTQEASLPNKIEKSLFTYKSIFIFTL